MSGKKDNKKKPAMDASAKGGITFSKELLEAFGKHFGLKPKETKETEEQPQPTPKPKKQPPPKKPDANGASAATPRTTAAVASGKKGGDDGGDTDSAKTRRPTREDQDAKLHETTTAFLGSKQFQKGTLLLNLLELHSTGRGFSETAKELDPECISALLENTTDDELKPYECLFFLYSRDTKRIYVPIATLVRSTNPKHIFLRSMYEDIAKVMISSHEGRHRLFGHMKGAFATLEADSGICVLLDVGAVLEFVHTVRFFDSDMKKKLASILTQKDPIAGTHGWFGGALRERNAANLFARIRATVFNSRPIQSDEIDRLVAEWKAPIVPASNKTGDEETGPSDETPANDDDENAVEDIDTESDNDSEKKKQQLKAEAEAKAKAEAAEKAAKSKKVNEKPKKADVKTETSQQEDEMWKKSEDEDQIEQVARSRNVGNTRSGEFTDKTSQLRARLAADKAAKAAKAAAEKSVAAAPAAAVATTAAAAAPPPTSAAAKSDIIPPPLTQANRTKPRNGAPTNPTLGKETDKFYNPELTPVASENHNGDERAASSSGVAKRSASVALRPPSPNPDDAVDPDAPTPTAEDAERASKRQKVSASAPAEKKSAVLPRAPKEVEDHEANSFLEAVREKRAKDKAAKETSAPAPAAVAATVSTAAASTTTSSTTASSSTLPPSAPVPLPSPPVPPTKPAEGDVHGMPARKISPGTIPAAAAALLVPDSPEPASPANGEPKVANISAEDKAVTSIPNTPPPTAIETNLESTNPFLG